MNLTAPAGTRTAKLKRIVLVDAVDWSDAYPKGHPKRDVGDWFIRHFRDDPSLSVEVVHARDDVLEAIRQGANGVIMSGSPRDAWANDPVNARLAQLILECRDRHIAFLGVCFGHQLLGHVLGGEVSRHPCGVELGTVTIELTEAGQSSPLFAGFPRRFEVLESHQDAVLGLPPGAELLATGEHTAIQAFRYGDHLMGVQFHPEMDPEILRFVWEPRRKTWRDKVDFNIDERLDSLSHSPTAPNVLRNFVSRCIR